MSNANTLTWDNMEEVIASLPKDDKGHFLLKPNKLEKKDLALSTERDSWANFDPVAPLIRKETNTVGTIVDVLIDDGFIKPETKKLWLQNYEMVVSQDKNLVTVYTACGVIEISKTANNFPNESIVKINDRKFYVTCTVNKEVPKIKMGKNFSEDLSADAEVVNLNFGSGKGIAQMGAALIVNSMRKEGKTSEAEQVEKAFHLNREPSKVESVKITTANNIKEIATDFKGKVDGILQDARKNITGVGDELNIQATKELNITNWDTSKIPGMDGLGEAFKSKPLFPISSGAMSDEMAEVAGVVSNANYKHLALPIDKEQTELENDPLLRAQRGLASLDTSDAEAELAQQAEVIERTKQLKESGLLEIVNSPLTNPNMTPAELKAWSETNIEKAKASIIGVDKLITYAGRLNVQDKFLMNCPADLNQLIPFKYNWAWSFYLTSSANHWMPGESNLYAIANTYKSANNTIKKLVARAWYTHNAKLGLFGENVLVNLYRQITNPESRQYLLRQGQEFIVVRHAWMEINDCLNVNEMLIEGKTPAASLAVDNVTFNKRTLLTRNLISHIRDLTSTTETTEKLAEFLKAFIIGYTCTNWLTPLVSYYQVITTLEFNETCQPLAHIFMNLIRDNISQFEFAKLFIAGVIEENPMIVSDKWSSEILKAIEDLISLELSLVKTLSAGENDEIDIKYICNHYKDDVMSIIDPFYQRATVTGDVTRGYEFVQIIKTLTPNVDHEAGLGAMQW